MVLALIFAELLAGGVLVVSAITGHTPSEVIKGEAEDILSLKETKSLKGESGSTSSKSQSGGTSSSEPAPTSPGAPPNLPATSAPSPKQSGSGYTWQQVEKLVKEGRVPKTELEKGLKELESGSLAHITLAK